MIAGGEVEPDGAAESAGWRRIAEQIKARLAAYPAYPWEKAALWEMVGWCEWRADLLDVE